MPIRNRQMVEKEPYEDECEFEFDDGFLGAEGPSVALVVSATDFSGNENTATAEPQFTPGDDDDDDDDD